MIYLILVYICSLIVSWLSIRNYELSSDSPDAEGFEVFLCLCPLVNTITIFVLLWVRVEEHEWNWNRFFRIK